MNEKYPEFTKNANLGGIICAKLKNIYYPVIAWSKCYKLVGNIFSNLKKNSRKLFASDTEEEFLRRLSKMPDDDLKMLLEDYK